MTTVAVDGQPSVVDDGTSAVVHVLNTGPAEVYLTPGNLRLAAAASTIFYPEGREVTAFCLGGNTATLTVTVNPNEIVEAPEVPAASSLSNPSTFAGMGVYNGWFGVDNGAQTLPAGGTTFLYADYRYLLTVEGGGDEQGEAEDEWMYVGTGEAAKDLVVKKPGWYMLDIYAQMTAGDPLDNAITVNVTIVPSTAMPGWNATLQGANIQAQGRFPVYLQALDSVVMMVFYPGGPVEDDITLWYLSLSLQPLSLTGV